MKKLKKENKLNKFKKVFLTFAAVSTIVSGKFISDHAVSYMNDPEPRSAVAMNDPEPRSAVAMNDPEPRSAVAMNDPEPRSAVAPVMNDSKSLIG
ncbi:hypothetical protein [Bacillus cereus group sp. BfR-BA-01331]|uniref:hypothetical protein n=1 Tax=Bacillus cereus group sp. BfR-BA-01331 TaxID=2920307 RepID=UPI001F575AFA|nr:hypothetical protein [Bacillus cereus group sp. BfR-BA-01331]